MKMKLPIYLDHHATTPVDPSVLEAMLPTLKENFGNPASRNHIFGVQAEKAVEKARSQAAHIIGAEADEIIFTSGATESVNLAIKGAAFMYRGKGNHIVTCVAEHRAVLDTCKTLARAGFEITYLPVAKDGRLAPEMVRASIRPTTLLVAVMHSNNEIGTLQPIEEIGKIAHEKGVLFFSDATQSVGKVPVNVNTLEADLLCFSSHKMYGPKGAGALYVRNSHPHVRLMPLIDGGGHEKSLRSGTLNVPGIVGFGAACEWAEKLMGEESKRVKALRDKLLNGITSALDHVSINGSMEHRLPHNLNLSFAYVEGESLLTALGEDIAVSSGSACTSATLEPSHVLKALGIGEEISHSSVRFGLGRFNTEEEIDYVIRRVVDTVKSLRALSPVYDMINDTERRKRAAS